MSTIAAQSTSDRAVGIRRTVNRPGIERTCPHRTLAHVAIVAIAAVAVVAAASSSWSQPAPPQAGSWAAVTVGPSGTLWSLASEHPIEGLSTAATVQAIRQHNRLSSSTIHTGQVVLVPASAEAGLLTASR